MKFKVGNIISYGLFDNQTLGEILSINNGRYLIHWKYSSFDTSWSDEDLVIMLCEVATPAQIVLYWSRPD
jgi:hypothetical protein